MAAILVTGTLGMPQAVQANPAGGAWFATRGAAYQARATHRGVNPGMPSTMRQQQQARAKLERSVANLGRTAAAISAAQAAQQAAREAARQPGADVVPDGLVEGGLKVDTDALTAGWLNAKAPAQSTANGRTQVNIEQTADRAILNWETFNVGRNTTVQFQQDRNWAVLNRVNDPQARPSQIQGQIKADGTVMVVNRNGVVFTGSSQVNVRNLVAAAATITDDQFRDRGRMIAGRDIVSSGTGLGVERAFTDNATGSYASSGNLFVNTSATDVSLVQAGRDILYGNFNVAGPGSLEISAGRNLLMNDEVAVTSLGAVAPGDTRSGASIVLQAGATQADFSGFLQRYLDTDSLALAGTPLAEQPGKVVRTYESELVEWLAGRYGFSGDGRQAREFLADLPPEQQRIFAREVYFAELKAGGREYNEVGGLRQGSYLRGRNAIAALFPEHDAAGNPIRYSGDIIMYGGAGVHTHFGGDIQLLTPGGQQVFGIEGKAPPSTAGVITQGRGNIQLYALGSILLGQSRIMTTFGGDILAWSATGDINAGRGSKTTVVYTPPRRVYDAWGNVTISPDVPSTGAGIATLNPIPEVAPGDVDLIAPLGTIDAGEAGIRSSGTVNVAALQVVNAANIQAGGETVGVPVAAAVNVGALTSASTASSSAATAAQETVQRTRAQQRQNLPSIINVQILGFGEDGAPAAPGASAGPAGGQAAVDRAEDLVQLVGRGDLSAGQMAGLTADERRHLGL